MYAEAEVQQLQPLLNHLINKKGRWSFDLEDSDNILRVETGELRAVAIAGILHSAGFDCEELSD